MMKLFKVHVKHSSEGCTFRRCRVLTALQSFVGGDLMSHPSWTISWDVLSTSISLALSFSVFHSRRWWQRGAVARVIYVLNGPRYSLLRNACARGTTDDGDGEALVVHSSYFWTRWHNTKYRRMSDNVYTTLHQLSLSSFLQLGRCFPSF